MKGSSRFGPVLLTFLFFTSFRIRTCLASSLSSNDLAILAKTCKVFRSSLRTVSKLNRILSVILGWILIPRRYSRKGEKDRGWRVEDGARRGIILPDPIAGFLAKSRIERGNNLCN